MPSQARPAPAAHRLDLTLLGAFELRQDGTHVAVSVRTERLLSFLAIAAMPVARSVVAGTLWPEASTARALASVRSALWTLPRLFVPLVVADGPNLRIAEEVQVDLRGARRLAATAVDGTPEDGAHGVELLAADLLPTWSEDWLLIEQERFRQARLHALEAWCVALAAHGEHAQAVQLGLLAVAADPLRETAHRALMTAHLAESNQVEAVRQYHLYARLLRTELGIAPSAQMARMLDFGRPVAVTSR